LILAGRMEKEMKYPNIMNPMPGGLASKTEPNPLVTYLQDELHK
jgi:hypothetical protein